MEMKVMNNSAYANQPQKHTTAKHLVNIGATGAALYGVKKAGDVLIGPYFASYISGNKLALPKSTSKVYKFFDKVGQMIIPQKALLEMAKSIRNRESFEVTSTGIRGVDTAKVMTKLKGFRGIASVVATAGAAALTIVGLGVYNAFKIDSK